MKEKKRYNTSDLILKINKSYNPIKLDLDVWDRFLDVLCGDREYQKNAIINSIIYLASENYKSLKDLVAKNWKTNKNIKKKYETMENYIDDLQFSDKLFANIDLATGTGKSYVMYGIAQIILGIGLVDKVLILCPSTTIESGLKSKFQELVSSNKIKQSIPDDASNKNISIISGNNTIKPGDICIENIHAIYQNTNSSIKDSLLHNGKKTLVLNDESHHIFNKINEKTEEGKSIKKWKEFLREDSYEFKYILGFTGTAYIGDEYFNDVIYRYSLREAVNDGIVKMIDYVSEDESITEKEKLQKIYDNHCENIAKYSKVKPLTIFVTKDVKNAKRLANTVIDFIAEKEIISKEEAEKKVLIVTSAKEHKANVKRLKCVDSKTDSTQWIVSVSMLTEGWDVKNVFQIVPWEDRAFNSKLLIAQVLGRGLRIPNEYSNPQPRVKVFNHDSWSKNIKYLVEEILEIEVKLYSNIISKGDRSIYNFNLYNLSYDKIPKVKESSHDTYVFDYSKGYIDLISQIVDVDKETQYTNLKGQEYTKITRIEYDNYSIDEVVNKIYDEFLIKEWEGKLLKLPDGEFGASNLPSKEQIRKIVNTSLLRVGITDGKISAQNRYKILSAFGTLNRRKGKTIIYERKVKEPILISTDGMINESLSIRNLKKDSAVFFTSDFKDEIDKDVADILNEIIIDTEFTNKSKIMVNKYLFKTAMSIVFTKSDPERRFVEYLCKKENASKIISWIKSRDQNFYSIDYSWRKGGHQKQSTFNPDFFIKLNNDNNNYIIVIEIKMDKDISDENKAKYKYAKEHFDKLNYELKQRQINQKYIFHFLSPNSYIEFFEYLRNGKLINGEFTSELDDLLCRKEDLALV